MDFVRYFEAMISKWELLFHQELHQRQKQGSIEKYTIS